MMDSYLDAFILKIINSYLLTEKEKRFLIKKIADKEIYQDTLDTIENVLNKGDIFFENYLKDLIGDHKKDIDSIYFSLQQQKIIDQRKKELEENREEIEDIINMVKKL